MANFSFFDRAQIEQGQAQKEVTANDALEALAKAAGVLSKSVAAAGTINLTQPESEHGVILLTGAPGAAVNVVQDPDTTKPTLFQNLTTGGQTIEVRMGAGTDFAVPANSLLLLLSATDAVVFGSDATPLALATVGASGTSEELARADHRHPRDWVPLTFNAATATWTDQPAGNTEFLGLTDRRRRFDLTNFTQVRLIANVEVAGAATPALLRAEYSTDESAWLDLEDGGGAGPQVDISTTGTKVSSVVTIPSGAQADVFLRIVGIDGDGAADPEIGLVEVQAR